MAPRRQIARRRFHAVPSLYEMDLHGNIGWKHSGVAPTSLQRLPNGNTVVSTYQRILEITRDGKTVFTYPTQGHTYHARKTPDGHYVWIDACGEIGEVDDKGKLIAKTRISGGLSWGSIERLRNGRYLVALGGTAGKVQEIDMAGKVYWEKAVNNPNRSRPPRQRQHPRRQPRRSSHLRIRPQRQRTLEAPLHRKALRGDKAVNAS